MKLYLSTTTFAATALILALSVGVRGLGITSDLSLPADKKTGQLTFYDFWNKSPMSCGVTPDPEGYIAALPAVYMKAACGKCIKLVYNNEKAAIVKALDTCPECPDVNVDTSDLLFERLIGDRGKGRVAIEWGFVDCDSGSAGNKGDKTKDGTAADKNSDKAANGDKETSGEDKSKSTQRKPDSGKETSGSTTAPPEAKKSSEVDEVDRGEAKPENGSPAKSDSKAVKETEKKDKKTMRKKKNAKKNGSSDKKDKRKKPKDKVKEIKNKIKRKGKRKGKKHEEKPKPKAEEEAPTEQQKQPSGDE